MEQVTLQNKVIQGIQVRTNNANEANPDSAKIGQLWQSFCATDYFKNRGDAPVYGVYHDFESDDKGDYSLLTGVEVEAGNGKDAQVTLANGNYLVFRAEGKMPDVVFETWAKIWAYFDSTEATHKRAYQTDFEYYLNDQGVDIYISVE